MALSKERQKNLVNLLSIRDINFDGMRGELRVKKESSVQMDANEV